MKKAVVVAVISLVVGLVVSSCNTYKRCPAYGYFSIENASDTDKV